MTAPASARPRRRFPWPVYLLLLMVILLVALAPMISVMIAGLIAETNGCVLNEGNMHPCLVNGEDVGGTLYPMFVLGWFMLASLPMGTMALAVLLLAFLIYLLIWYRRRLAA